MIIIGIKGQQRDNWFMKQKNSNSEDDDLKNTRQPFSLTNEMNQNKNKSKLSVTIMLPQDYLRFRDLQFCISNELSKINRGNFNFTQKFQLDSYSIIINKNYNDISES
jgi:hypothetical protein